MKLSGEKHDLDELDEAEDEDITFTTLCSNNDIKIKRRNPISVEFPVSKTLGFLYSTPYLLTVLS